MIVGNGIVYEPLVFLFVLTITGFFCVFVGTENLCAEVERLLAETKAKDERLDEFGQKLFSLEQSVQELNAALADESQLHEATLASLEKERQEMATLEAERNALAEERDQLQRAIAELTSKVIAVETEARGRAEGTAAEVGRLGEELQAAQALAKEHEEEALDKSKVAATLEQEVEMLKEKAKLETSRAPSGGQTFSEALQGLQQECQSLARTSLAKNERIKELERELDKAHSQVQQLDDVCGELEKLCDHQQNEARNHQAQLDAERLALDDAKRQHNELQKDAQGLREQLACREEQLQAARAAEERVAEMERQLQETDAQRHGLEVKLNEAQSQQKQEATAEQQGALIQQRADIEAVTRELSE